MNQPPPSSSLPSSADATTARQWWPDDVRTLVWDTLQTAEDDDSTDIVERGDRILAALYPHAVLRQALLALAEDIAPSGITWDEDADDVWRERQSCAERLRALAKVPSAH